MVVSVDQTGRIMTPAIRLSQLAKRYPLYSGQLAQVLGAFGLRRAPSWKVALDGIDLTVGRGEKVGVIGRNGSGKTTLLRLVMGQTMPTSGKIDINGSAQGLMQTGFGFHDEMTGLDNIANALLYNGVTGSDLDAAIADIVAFVELGEFIHHPIKTYSLGMRARLEFAAATAIRPDILVIDEVLGAGDGYFVAKCAERMRQIVSGSTLLLVSHSLDQILQYCERVVWLDGGRIVDDGPAQALVTAYQQFMAKENARIHGLIADADAAGPATSGDAAGRVPAAVATLRPAPEPSIAILDVRFEDGDATFLATETGSPLALSCKVSSTGPRTVLPVVFGATQHGALVFEAAALPLMVAGETTIRLACGRFGIGVGNYVLTPALRDAASGEILCVGARALSLRMLPTNWSDPPRIHLDGTWRDEESGTQLETKISAWT